MSTRYFRVDGIVQGVGFRPFVHRTARALGLDGWVANVNGHVEGEVAGPPARIEEFAARLRADAPPLARVRDVHLTAGSAHPAYDSGFEVRPSAPGAADRATREIPPDAALCEACLRELRDPRDRRYRYPFINCTDCGPRATIIEDLPYDRGRTTMRRFPLCPRCAAEYADPADRRFHAEPVACPTCGPRLAWADLRGEEALRAAVQAVAEGGIVALKGLGGYQLVCDAGDPRAVAELRRRKRRPAKPFAVMVPDLAAATRLAVIGTAERQALLAPERPVVLLTRHRRHATSALAPEVHPGLSRVGLFLPTTGLHQLLLDRLARPLVVTSGNLSDEPIAVDDTEARRSLGGIADGFLTHDRPIRNRYDDSVVQFAGRTRITVRRARGLAPAPLPLAVDEPVAGAGTQLKHTFTLAAHGRALIGPHTGDLSDQSAHDAFLTSYAHLKRLSGIEPVALAHDLHPGYLSTQWAKEQSVRLMPVQHHHAHVAACAAEHGVRGAFVGVAYDGLGLGDDGTLWGGEILVADLTGYRRVGRFATAPLPGGDAAVRHPSRTALGHLLGGEPLGSPRPYPWLVQPFVDRLDRSEVDAVRAMVAHNVNCPRASSAGRLFDTVAALLGLADRVSYEGEAAVRVEAAAGDTHAVPLAHRIVRTRGLWVYDSAPTLADLLARRLAGEPVGRLAAAFHLTLAIATAELVARAVAEGAPRTVCLGGGCFVNRRLLTEVRRRLRAHGLRVLVGGQVPVGDGGISYGQAAVAAARLAGER
ncbi:Carbamoyltransferase hypF [Streptomyces davaonensis JCM 4913]|uniref:Carbamoyltransferase n=1 Tax=Streptomyces davaonensis (strain DSM 101723 / JCM 4913 / KCC S-0913 / 768) TaxID=1214101 RepID=K4R8A4_STRDJ|nr:carbamoyltransferase HypF [Streptomyces davaonensis]CCK32521.1 Carbamoyltransferase hypF [Streptomyces davaonensis JCM 4913]